MRRHRWRTSRRCRSTPRRGGRACKTSSRASPPPPRARPPQQRKARTRASPPHASRRSSAPAEATMRFRYAYASHPDWSVATEECALLLQRYAGDERYVRNANLGFLYLTDALIDHADQILATLKARTGIPNWVGASGVGVCATGVEFYEEPAIAVML